MIGPDGATGRVAIAIARVVEKLYKPSEPKLLKMVGFVRGMAWVNQASEVAANDAEAASSASPAQKTRKRGRGKSSAAEVDANRRITRQKSGGSENGGSSERRASRRLAGAESKSQGGGRELRKRRPSANDGPIAGRAKRKRGDS